MRHKLQQVLCCCSTLTPSQHKGAGRPHLLGVGRLLLRQHRWRVRARSSPYKEAPKPTSLLWKALMRFSKPCCMGMATSGTLMTLEGLSVPACMQPRPVQGVSWGKLDTGVCLQPAGGLLGHQQDQQEGVRGRQVRGPKHARGLTSVLA